MNLQKIPIYIKNIFNLNVSDNKIKVIPASFSKPDNRLLGLRICNNLIKRIPYLSNLVYLEIRGNAIEKISKNYLLFNIKLNPFRNMIKG